MTTNTRLPLVVGNWKMNTTLFDAVELADRQARAFGEVDGVEVCICPPFISLAAVRDTVSGSRVCVGAQNCFDVAKGAYTGEVSAEMLRGLADYVIIGHSERRQHCAENDECIRRKVRAVLEAAIRPILCVGESLAEYDAGRSVSWVRRQVREDLSGLPAASVDALTVAYEPVWAIGTGKASHADHAVAVARGIRGELANQFGDARAASVRVLYGGSVTSKNIGEFVARPEIDGALVGGASLTNDFIDIVKRTRETALQSPPVN